MIEFDLLFYFWFFIKTYIYNSTTAQTDVVDINDNTVTEEIKDDVQPEPVKDEVEPKAKSRARG